MSFFPNILVPVPFSLCMESTSYISPFRIVFFYFVTTGWIFNIISAYVSIIQSIKNQTRFQAGICKSSYR